jgi:hypothetical protein
MTATAQLQPLNTVFSIFRKKKIEKIGKNEPHHAKYKTLTNVKASNFGPHVNFGPFLARSIASLGEFCAKNEQNGLSKSKVRLQLLFYFSVGCVFDNTPRSPVIGHFS